jgi:hypothetical protein
MDKIFELFQQLSLREKLGTEKREKIYPSLEVNEVIKRIKDGTIKKIVVMSGAGISVAAGIPDFRSPKTGLYANLQKYNLPYPEAIFELTYGENAS